MISPNDTSKHVVTRSTDVPTVRAHVLEVLSTPDADTRFSNSYLGTAIQQRIDCRPHQIWEVVWGLVGGGLVYLDRGEQPAPENWRFKLSATGIEAAVGQAAEPSDPEGYLRRLDRQVPALDPAARVYVAESVHAFAARCYLSSSVMLGVAAERAFLGLAEALAAAMAEQASKLRRELDNPRSSQRTRFDELRKVLDSHRKDFPEQLVDTLTLDAVGDLLRVARNESGHPTGQLIDQDTARAHLLIATSYLQKMTELRQLLESRAAAGAPTS
jgi:hypothetical protein